MGSNIFLEWDNRTEEEKQRQIDSIFDISRGHLGYLRASLGMMSESSFLRAFFSKEYWEAGSKGLRFEFTEEKYNKLMKAGILYLISAYTGKELKCSESEREKETHDTIFNTIKKAGYSEDNIKISGSLNFRTAVIWLESVFSFFELGMELEEKKLNPRVVIEW